MPQSREKQKMDQLDSGEDFPNVNVTWPEDAKAKELVTRKKFPCPVCGKGMEIRASMKKKPYSICDDCGIQLFFRGKKGIRRLREILDSDVLITGNESKVDQAVLLFNRIQQLSVQRKRLKAKRGLILSNPDLENAILAVDNEVERLQGELEKLAGK
jgi:predicted RNA-binding Zn-ribbon protein involved in translation (DUF1610 family)